MTSWAAPTNSLWEPRAVGLRLASRRNGAARAYAVRRRRGQPSAVARFDRNLESKQAGAVGGRCGPQRHRARRASTGVLLSRSRASVFHGRAHVTQPLVPWSGTCYGDPPWARANSSMVQQRLPRLPPRESRSEPAMALWKAGERESRLPRGADHSCPWLCACQPRGGSAR